MSENESFCSGSRTSSSALVGFPLRDSVILSISSRTNTGFVFPAFFIPLIIRPGRAPRYVLLCPLISDSSFTPPRLTLTYGLSSAAAILFPRLVFPVPGGPTNSRIDPCLSFFILRTVKCCIILVFTFFNP